MMEAAPSAPLIVSKPDFLLELLIVALDTPAQLGKVDELSEADIHWQRRQPILGRSGFALGPLDQQTFRRQQFRQQLAMSDPNAHAAIARRQPIGRTFAPSDRAPGPLGQTARQLFGRDQIGFVATARIVQRLAFPPRSGGGWAHQGFALY